MLFNAQEDLCKLVKIVQILLKNEIKIKWIFDSIFVFMFYLSFI